MSSAVMMSPDVGPPGLGCSITLWYHCQQYEPTFRMTAMLADDLQEEVSSEEYLCTSDPGWRHSRLFIGEYSSRVVVSTLGLGFMFCFLNVKARSLI